MGNRIMRLIAAQYGDRNISVLDESPPVEAAAKRAQTAAGSAGNLSSFGVRPMSWCIAEEAESLAHLRFGLVDWAVLVCCPILPIRLIVGSAQVES
jgi:hypothetical protein